jgi:VWFA-related protein
VKTDSLREALMKKRNPTLLILFLSWILLSVTLFGMRRAFPQTRERRVNNEPATSGTNSQTPEVVSIDVDLVVIDALVLQKNTARIVGDLKKDDFVLTEDGVKQEITHFGQDSLPLSVLLLIDRGGCLDPFGSQVRHAALEAVSRLKPTDEVAVMTYHDTTRLLQGFTQDRDLIKDALYRVPPHDEEANHCLNKAFFDAADYMLRSGNPVGRRVIVTLTGITRNLDCPDGPSGKTAMQAVYESGSVVCAIVPHDAEQAVENGVIGMVTRSAGAFGAPTLSLAKLAEETGGEILEDKPERLDLAFNTLMNHLRTRYSLGFVSSNKKHDGTLRKLKIDVSPTVQKTQGKLVVKARHSYVAPRNRSTS